MTASTTTLEHAGEWRVALRGDSRAAIFGAVARLVADAAGDAVGAPGDWERVVLAARDAPALLVDWANELIGRGEAAHRAYGDVAGLAIEGDASLRLVADIRGRRVPHWLSPLKAATYHGARLEPRDGDWHAELLFDV